MDSSADKDAAEYLSSTYVSEQQLPKELAISSRDKRGYVQSLTADDNILEGTAITAVELSEKEIKDLEKNLSIKYNKNVTLNNIVDETILGGVLVKLGNEEIDGTVRTRLSKMKNQLSQVIS